MMKRVVSGAIALSMVMLLSAPAVWTVETMAQTTPAQAPMQEKQVEGKIQKVAGNKVTLANGIELTIPAGVKVDPAGLKPGAIVRASYEEKGGQKVVTNLQVQP